MLLREALDRPELRLTLLTGADGLERPISRVYVTDLPDPRRYLSGGELVLTGLMWRRQPADSEAFVAACAAAEVAAIGAGDAAYGSVPSDLIDACRRHRVPLFEVPIEVSFREIIDEVTPSLWAERASGLATVLGRQRGLVAALAAGARLADLLPAVAADLDVDCRVLSPTGRFVAGTGAASPAGDGELAGAFLRAGRLPVRLSAEGRMWTLVAVPGRPEHRLTSWVLACASPAGADPPARAEGIAELVSLVALERAQVDQRVRVERRLAEQVGGLLTVGGEPADLRARLLSCGLVPESTFLVLAASLTGPAMPPELAVTVVEELVRPQASQVTVPVPPDGVLAVVAVDPRRTGQFVAELRDTVARLAPALGTSRFAVGVGGPVTGAAALTGAVEEARHAHRSATTRPDQATVVRADELASHLLLLSGVPADTRRAFRDRLLGPLTEYDRAHGADLVRTLDTFLSCSGSWSRSADLLHVHVNTLRYRIGRVEQLTGRDLSRFEDRIDLFLALRLR